MRKDWGKMAEEYLAGREQLMLSIQLVDARHKPSELDMQLYEWLTFHQKNNIVIATKADKISNNKLFNNIKTIEKAMPDSRVLAYSAITGKGKEEVWREIEDAVN
jgi:GTP-binding protein